MYARDYALIATPIGMVRIEGSETSIDAIGIEPVGNLPRTPQAAAVIEAARQIGQWFAGKRTEFDLPLSPAKTARGQALRDGMIAIPYGESMRYGELAQRIGSAARAVGQACARNPFPIVVPCHRVLSSSGPENYSAGAGVSTKAWLLDHERRHSGKLLL